MAVANGFSFLIPARLEHARILPLQLWITYPVLRTGPTMVLRGQGQGGGPLDSPCRFLKTVKRRMHLAEDH